MSADIWLEDEHGGQLEVNASLEAEMRDLVPMRTPSEVTATTFNLTYNLTPMLTAAGMPAWRDMLGMRAGEAGAIWRKVHATLDADPIRFSAMNPSNGWGTYAGAVEVIGQLATACERYPDAKIGGWL